MAFVKKAYDISRKKVFFCSTNDPISKVAEKMHINNIGSILVKEGDLLNGIITVNGLLRQMAKNVDSAKIKAKDIMSSPVITASKDLEIDEIVDVFNKHKVSRMVLVDDSKKIVGVVRDIAVYKCMTVFKYDKEVKTRFDSNYLHRLY